MSGLTRREAARWLSGRDRFLILTHRKPDGDTVGSAAALCLGLRKLGKTAHVLRNMEITEKYRGLHEGLNKDCPENGDTLIAVDVASPALLPDPVSHLARFVRLRIDHHGKDTPFAPLELVDAASASCAELVYDLLTLLGVTLDKALAEALYTAVATDTGCFRYANTTAHSFRVAAACMEAGAPVHGINQRLFETNSLSRLRLQSWMTEHMRFYQEGALAVCPLPLTVIRALSVTEEDLDGLAGFPRTVEGVRLAALLRELPDGSVKLSLRAVPGCDAAAVCEKFGGGGHKGAAGATLRLPLEAAAALVAEEMRGALTP